MSSKMKEVVNRRMSRRQFLSRAAVAGTGMVLAACAPPGAPATSSDTSDSVAAPDKGSVHLLQWSSFIEPMDELLIEQSNAWGAENNVEVQIERINQNDIAARIAAAVQSQDGPDVVESVENWGHLFADNLVDVSDLAEQLDSEFGGYQEDQVAFSKVGDTWRTLPYTIIPNSHIYRTDFFEEVLGSPEWTIDTFEDYINVAAQMKEGGHPFGNSLGHSFGDPVTFWYAWFWGYGGTEVNEDASEVTLNSAETVAGIEAAVELFNTGFIDGVLAWDDGSNNRSYLAGEVACTLNGASIYFVANRDFPDVAEVSDHGLHPAGPAGRFSYQGGRSHGIFSYSENVDAVKEFMLHIRQPDQYNPWLETGQGYDVGPLHAFDDHPVFEKDPKLLPFRDAVTSGTSRWPGYPSPPNAEAFVVRNDYIIVDIFAKACNGEMTPEEAAEWGANEVAQRFSL